MDKLKIPVGVNPVTGKPVGSPVNPQLETSASKMRDKAEAAAKAGKFGDAMEAYFGAEKLFRDAKSNAAADSMKAAAQAMAVKAKKVGMDKAYAKTGPKTDAEIDASVANLKKWAMGTNPAYAKSVKDAEKAAKKAAKSAPVAK